MSNQTILIVDDEVHIRRLLQGTLNRSGYDTLEAVNAVQALEQARTRKPDAILLDLGLPDRDGLEIIQLLKRVTPAPIIVVSARDATEQKVAALDLGAHDYVTKPFDSEEVLARLRGSLRDRVLTQGAIPVISSGQIKIDLANRDVTRAGEDVHLTRKEFNVLTELALHPGRVVTHQRMLEAAWPHDHDRRIDYLRIVVRNLRQKLEPNPAQPVIIVNELGIGYRFMID